ncbi:MAG: efflux RND transporter permease subunit, partial [Desulfuromonadaceae bacterium]|nr:efflux RND transporter permease subunit [Desulfuromonadaceae bacterium]
LTPMLCSRFLKPPASQKHGGVYNAMERLFNGMLQMYERSLSRVLRFRRTTVVVTFAMMVVTVWLFTRMPMGLLPADDIGAIFAITEGAQGVSFEEMKAQQKKLMDIVLQEPNIEAFMSSVGSSGSRVGSNSGFMFMKLKPRHERELNADQIIQKLRPKVMTVPGIMMFMQNPPPIRLEATLAKAQYQFVLQSPDSDELYRQAAAFEMKVRALSMLQDVTSDLQIKNPQVNLEIDRDRAASMGVTAQKIEDTLYSAYGSRQVSTIFSPTNQYQVIMELEPRYQLDPTSLGLLYVRSGTTGQLVPLSSLGTLKNNLGPLSVNHLGQITAVTISFNLKPDVPLGDAVAAVEKEAKSLPAAITTGFQGTAQVYQASTKGLALLLIIAILVIYIVLGVLYESYIHPLTILSGLPSAGFGALITLLIFGKDLNLYSFVGIIMLVGIVKKNAIMMIDFALEAQRNEGKTPMEAIYQGCLVRFRPIMMTSMAALMGTLPIAIGFGAGAESRRGLGLAVVGGLLVSQLLTLYITPVIYYYMDRIQSIAMQRFKRAAEIDKSADV